MKKRHYIDLGIIIFIITVIRFSNFFGFHGRPSETYLLVYKLTHLVEYFGVILPISIYLFLRYKPKILAHHIIIAVIFLVLMCIQLSYIFPSISLLPSLRQYYFLTKLLYYFEFIFIPIVIYRIFGLDFLKREEIVDTDGSASFKVIKLKEENYISHWATMIPDAHGNSKRLYDDVQNRLRSSKIPWECKWEMVELKSSTWRQKIIRPALLVTWKRLKDYKSYVLIRDFGIYLDVAQFTMQEPGFFKKILSKILFWNYVKGERMLSLPANILSLHDLECYNSAVYRSVRGVVDEFSKEKGLDPNSIKSESKGILDVW